jgi:uncharacterized protein (DUF486 family)
MSDLTQTRWLPVMMLVLSNVFMTFAWYGHRRFSAAAGLTPGGGGREVGGSNL